MHKVRSIRIQLARATRGGRYGYGYGYGYRNVRKYRYRGFRQQLRRAIINGKTIRRNISKFGATRQRKQNLRRVLAKIRALRRQMGEYRNAGETRRGSRYRYRGYRGGYRG